MAETKAATSTRRGAAARGKTAAAPDPTADDLDMAPELPELPVEQKPGQFPATDGTDEGREREIAKRSADGQSPGRFVKTIRVGRLAPADDDPLHTANAVGVVQEAMQRGLHARGDVFLTRAEEHDEPLNASGVRRSQYTDLTYEVGVVPASIDTQPQDTTTPKVINTVGGGQGDATVDTGDVGDSS